MKIALEERDRIVKCPTCLAAVGEPCIGGDIHRLRSMMAANEWAWRYPGMTPYLRQSREKTRQSRYKSNPRRK